MILDQSQPAVRGHLSNKIRITVLGNPITAADKGLSASIRIINPQKLVRDDFIASGTASAEMLDFLTTMLRYGLSICVTGATGSGKTTLMAWLLSTIPNDMRLFTIENGCREFDLIREDINGNVVNNVVHTVTRYSEDDRQNIDQEKLLEFALTSNPDVICVGEMKSAEAFAAQEAARTGHTVITTTHANSCEATYNRMVTLCKTKYDINDKTLYNLCTEAFPIVLFAKKLEDSSRKIMEITECEIKPDGTREIHTLLTTGISRRNLNGGIILILPVIMIIVCGVGGVAAYLFIKQNDKNKYKTENASEKTANEFINVKDICGNFLYTLDGQILCFLRITPVSIDLYSKTEKKNIVRTLTADLSAMSFPFKFIAVSRPVDISPLLSELNNLLMTPDNTQHELLKKEMAEMANFAMGGEVVQRQFYISCWDKAIDGAERELLQRAKQFAENLGNSKIPCEILEQRDIVRLCNLVNNPEYTHLEDTGTEAAIPLIEGGFNLC